MTQAAPGPVGMPVRHPLAPLTVDETGIACRIALASGVAPGTRLVYCALDEPPKEAVFGWDGQALARRVLCVLYEKPARMTWLVTVSLDEETVVSRVPVPGAQPPVMIEEWQANAEQIKADPGFRAAMARRGITDMSRVQVDPWPAGHFGLDIDESGRRLARGVAYVLDGPDGNPYARPVENLVAILDRDTGEMMEIIDGDVVPVPAAPSRYDAAGQGTLRDLAPLQIIQPSGPGFTVGDGCLRWGPWQMRVSMHSIEGLVLHEICYLDGERTRPIIYRASMAEMVVPYGSVSASHWWKNAFDAGEGGLGKTASPLELGCDCLGEIVYLDAVTVDEDGNAGTLPHAICLHEEDYGVLWRHADPGSGTTEVRRSRRMVVSFTATVSNYDYGFFWYFYLDGTIQAEVKLTGIIQTQAVRRGTRVPYANPVTPELAGPHHQHLFGFRLDMCLDGPDNSVYEVDAVPVPPGPRNPYGNAFTARATLLETESAAQRMAAPERARYWKIVNRGSLNACGEPVGYKLVPQPSAPLLAQDTAAVATRAAFATRHLWVTPARPRGRTAPGGGLPEPAPRRRRAARLDRRRPFGHRHRHRAVAHGRRDPLLPAGGLPGHAGGVRRLLPQTIRLLRPQPRHRPGPTRQQPLPRVTCLAASVSRLLKQLGQLFPLVLPVERERDRVHYAADRRHLGGFQSGRELTEHDVRRQLCGHADLQFALGSRGRDHGAADAGDVHRRCLNLQRAHPRALVLEHVIPAAFEVQIAGLVQMAVVSGMQADLAGAFFPAKGGRTCRSRRPLIRLRPVRTATRATRDYGWLSSLTAITSNCLVPAPISLILRC
jgi:primary-amine oxidase